MAKSSHSFRLLIHVFLLHVVVSFVVPPNANPMSRNGLFRVPVAFASPAEEDAPTTSTTDESSDPSRVTLFNETVPMLWASRLVYTFASLVQAARDGNLTKIPAETLELMKSSERRNELFPQSFRQINALLTDNWEDLVAFANKTDDGTFQDFDYQLLEQLKRVEKQTPFDDTIWLESFDSLYQEKECVYGIVRDENLKRIIVTFRGSVADGTMDWVRNFQVQMTDMRLPKNLKTIMNKQEGNEDLETIPVHRGFYAYLFNNDEKLSGEQKFDRIREKLLALYTNPAFKDYKLYIVGHSLGAALSSMVAFKLAGSKKEWIPKPVTCISFESPMNGGVEFRDAFKTLEQEKLIRYLRVTNKEDVVPAIPPFSLRLKFWNQKLYKHVGLQLNLFYGGYDYVYPKNDNGFSRAWGNNFVTKRSWNVDRYHGMELVQERLDEHADALSTTYIDDLYSDETIVGDLFAGDSKDEL